MSQSIDIGAAGAGRQDGNRASSDPGASSVPFVPSVQLALESTRDFGRRPLLGMHDLHRSELFSDDALAQLLDGYPRRYLFALTMGTDPTRPDQNRLAVSDGLSGAELLRAVRCGRLWLNITRVDRFERRYRGLIDHLYAQLVKLVPGFRPDLTQGTMLLSSPHALVYYHADGPASVLWQLRGRKRIWVYPALDEHFAEREAVEDIIAGVRHEYLPFDLEFDDHAVTYELAPGQWTAWAQNAPHRVTNTDSVNVSLSTEHFTRQSRRRMRVYAANRFLRTRFGATGLSAREDGPVALMKTVIHRLARSAGLDYAVSKRHVPALRVDPDAPGGVAALDVPDAEGHAPAAAQVRS